MQPLRAVVTRDIIVEDAVPFAPQQIWPALVRPELIGRWLMETDFEPTVGRRFRLRSWPSGAWDGVLRCEVLEVAPHERLAYTWTGGTPDNVGYGAPIDSEVTWTLRPAPGGAWLRLEHAGFKSPENDAVFVAMSCGWAHICQRLIGVVRGLQTRH